MTMAGALVYAQTGPIRRAADGACVWTRSDLEDLRKAGLAHAPEWFTIINSAYGHQPLYMAARDADGQLGVLPAFVVHRPLLGTIVVSMPFLDSGGPCSASRELTAALLDRLLSEARRIGACAVDLRCSSRLPLPVAPNESKVNLTLRLPPDPDVLWRALGNTVRNQVRKAQRAGLEVEIGGAEALSAFYQLFAARMRDLGTPVHAFAFFREVLEAFGMRARIVVVHKAGAPVGALMALGFRDRLVVPWAACLKEYFSLCPNMLLYWETLRAASREGFRCFDFGRSTRDSGTYRFKRQWGTDEEPLFWYTIPLGRRAAASMHHRGTNTYLANLAVAAWQRLPPSVSLRIGPAVRKYLTQ